MLLVCARYVTAYHCEPRPSSAWYSMWWRLPTDSGSTTRDFAARRWLGSWVRAGSPLACPHPPCPCPPPSQWTVQGSERRMVQPPQVCGAGSQPMPPSPSLLPHLAPPPFLFFVMLFAPSHLHSTVCWWFVWALTGAPKSLAHVEFEHEVCVFAPVRLRCDPSPP